MRIFKQDLKTEVREEDCDFSTGRLVEREIVIEKGNSLIERKFEDDQGTLITHCLKEIKELVLIYTPYSEKEMCLLEIDKLRKWFINEYRELFEKCTRRIQLGILMSDGSDPKKVLNVLYKQAENNATRIRELEKNIQENNAND